MATKTNKKSDSREKARQLHEQQLKKEKRNARITMWSIVGVIVLVVALIIGFFIWNSSREIPEQGPAPTSASASGGLLLASTTEVVEGELAGQEVDVNDVAEPNTEAAAEGLTEIPGGEQRAAGEPVQVIVYADPSCTFCADFESANSEFIGEQLDAGNITLELRMVNYLDNPGTQNYSSRASNALVCTAEEAPESLFDFYNEIMTSYHEHQGSGLSNDEILERAEASGIDIADCVNGNTYRPFVEWTSSTAMADGVRGTPSIWVDGAESGAPSFQQDVVMAVEGGEAAPAVESGESADPEESPGEASAEAEEE